MNIEVTWDAYKAFIWGNLIMLNHEKRKVEEIKVQYLYKAIESKEQDIFLKKPGKKKIKKRYEISPRTFGNGSQQRSGEELIKTKTTPF